MRATRFLVWTWLAVGLALGLVWNSVGQQSRATGGGGSAVTAPLVIYEDDFPTDADNMFGLDLALKLHDMGAIRLLATPFAGYGGSNSLAVPMTDAFCRAYGHPEVLQGAQGAFTNSYGHLTQLHYGAVPMLFSADMATNFFHQYPDSTNYPDSLAIYRSLLDAAPANSVKLVFGGPVASLYRLQQSQPDQYSQYTGAYLLSNRCAEVICVLGWFPTNYPPQTDNLNYGVDGSEGQSSFWTVLTNNIGVPVSFMPISEDLPHGIGGACSVRGAGDPLFKCSSDWSANNGTDPTHNWNYSPTPQALFYAAFGAVRNGVATYAKIPGNIYYRPGPTEGWLTNATTAGTQFYLKTVQAETYYSNFFAQVYASVHTPTVVPVTQSSNVVGGVSAIAGTMSDPDANAYIVRAGVSNDADRRAITGFVTTLKTGGVWPYVVDAGFFRTNQGATSNLTAQMTTLLGRTCNVTNVAYDGFGFSFSNGVVVVRGLPDMRTNTMMVVTKNWGGTAGSARSDCPNIVGLYSAAAATSCERLFDRGMYGADFVNANSSSFSNGVNTLAFSPVTDNPGYFTADQKRRVVGVCFSNMNMQVWADGYRLSTTFVDNVASGYVPALPLTNLWMGGSPGGVNPLSCKIAGFVLLSSYGNTNHIQVVERALRWLEPSPVNTVFIGDSLTVNYSADSVAADPTYTNGWPWLWMNSYVNQGNECWWNEGTSGTQLLDWTFGGAYYGRLTNRLALAGVGGPVSKLRVYIQLGANDQIQSVASATSIGYYSNILRYIVGPYATEIYPVTITACGTNCQLVTGKGWTDAQDANRIAVNNWLAANPQMYTQLIDRAQVFSKCEMNVTNAGTGYTKDFLHPNIRGNTIFLQHLVGMESGTSPVRVSYYTNGTPSFATLLNGGAKFFGRSTTPSGWEVGVSNGVIWCSNGIKFYQTVSTDGTNGTTVSFP